MNRLFTVLASALLLPACASMGADESIEFTESMEFAGITVSDSETGLTRIAIRLRNGSSTAEVDAIRLFLPVDEDALRSGRGSAGYLIAESNRADSLGAPSVQYIDTIVALDPSAGEQTFLFEVETARGLLRGLIDVRPDGPSVVAGVASPQSTRMSHFQPKVSGKTRFKQPVERGPYFYDHGTAKDDFELEVAVFSPDEEKFKRIRVESLAVSWSVFRAFGALGSKWVLVHDQPINPPDDKFIIKEDFWLNSAAPLQVGDYVFLRASVELKQNSDTEWTTWRTSSINLNRVSKSNTADWTFDTPYPYP